MTWFTAFEPSSETDVSPAGPCEWCGGSQSWTIIRGDMYVSCDGGCLPLPLPGLVPPPDSPELVAPWGLRHVSEFLVEPSREEGVVPLEGGAAKVSVEEDYELPF